VERGICPITTSTINERTVAIIMAGCMAHEREGYISTSGLKSDATLVFLDPDFLHDAQRRETVSLYSLGRMFESYNGRYSVNISARGECTLHINGLELSDAGKFTCMEMVPGAPQIRKLATITVIGMYLV